MNIEKPTVIVRRTKDGEILVESSHAVRVVYLEDDYSGDWDIESDSAVLVDGKEMWVQRFDVQPTDVARVLSDMESHHEI
ncbi:hypothetical protein [Pseudomonas sp. Irchel 3E13]|uniref:hypothetical protein n=1 Tax=Pseudomonas sp. Irchel 3E13 TaxID=2008975 RepID=UPI000BA2F7FA|nr:hypothetical protein [Pseudomonas sp. Irchel 3E13]